MRPRFIPKAFSAAGRTRHLAFDLRQVSERHQIDADGGVNVGAAVQALYEDNAHSFPRADGGAYERRDLSLPADQDPTTVACNFSRLTDITLISREATDAEIYLPSRGHSAHAHVLEDRPPPVPELLREDDAARLEERHWDFEDCDFRVQAMQAVHYRGFS
jgi:hypothetical protein